MLVVEVELWNMWNRVAKKMNQNQVFDVYTTRLWVVDTPLAASFYLLLSVLPYSQYNSMGLVKLVHQQLISNINSVNLLFNSVINIPSV